MTETETETETHPKYRKLTHDDFAAAADLIEKHGKTEGQYRNEAGRMCTIGAIGIACGALRPTTEEEQLERCVGCVLGVEGENSSWWLDAVADDPLMIQFADQVRMSDETGPRYDVEIWSDNTPQHVVVRTLREFAKAKQDG